MIRRARFKIAERCDGAPSCTVEVSVAKETGISFDTSTGPANSRAVISVRPKGRRRVYTLPLATVAEMIVARVVKAEMAPGTVPLPRKVRR